MGWLLGERALTIVLQFVVGVVVIRHLGPSSFGTYSYAISFVALFAPLAQIGLDQIVVRELARPHRDDLTVLASAVKIRIVGSALGWLIMAGAAVLWVPTDTVLPVLLVSATILSTPYLVFDLWFQSRLESRYAATVRSIALIAASGTQLVLVLLDAPLVWFFVGYALNPIIESVGYVVVFGRVTDLPFPRPGRSTPETVRSLLRDAWPMVLSGVAVTIYMRIDQVMLRSMVDEYAVGIYATAAKLSEFWYFVPMIFAMSVFPHLVRSSPDPSSLERRTQLMYDALATMALAVAIPTTFLADEVIDLLFGAEYAASAPVLQLHIWSFLFVALGVGRERWLVAKNLTKWAMATTSIGAVLNVVLNLVLIPSHEGIGAAVATLVSYMAAAYACNAIFAPLRPAFRQMTRALWGLPRLVRFGNEIIEEHRS